MANICERIRHRRDRAVCGIFHGADVVPRKDRLRRLNYRDIPEELWIKVTRDEALALLTDCLARDLAYRVEIMPESEARDLASGFLDVFDADTEFLTNTRSFRRDSDPNPSYGWEPISHATFDTGIVAESKGVVGILWVEDED